MTANSSSAGPDAGRDPISLGLLLGGIALALVVAFALPALHFRGADKALLGISAWEAVPWLTKVKVAFLAVALASAFLPRLAPLRVPLLIGAAIMMLLPSVGALVAAVYQWSDVRAEIVQLSGVRTPWIDPGWGIIGLFAAAAMVLGALWRSQRAAA
ncbi:MAG: hypothetical protein K2X74_06490 [Acetobacteraceae bacterium]|nr:hypothetical protein [Acetobacteraceae bacterium]